MPPRAREGVVGRAIRSRVLKRRFCSGVGDGAGERPSRRAARAFGKERRARRALGILQKARGARRPVRIEATRARFRPGLLRRPDEKVCARCEGGGQRPCGAAHLSYRSRQILLPEPRPRVAHGGQLSKICCDGLTKLRRASLMCEAGAFVAFDLHKGRRGREAADGNRTKRNFPPRSFV